MARIIFTIIVAVLTPSLAFSQDGSYGHMDGWHMMHYGYGGFVMWLILIIAIILVIYMVTQLSKDKGSEKKTQETALEILKKRYARGEINKEEFERMKQDIKD